MNQGQICMSTERFIVDEAIADAFVSKFAAMAAKLPAGNPRGHVVLGSMVSEASAVRMSELIADAASKGAKLVAGGQRDGPLLTP
jgi:vanillin dehydrogenase